MKPTRAQRIGRAWLAVPWIVRVGILLALAIVVVTCSGCSHLSEPHYDADLIYQDENSCAANPRALPGCVIGIMVYVKWRWQ